MPASPFPLVRVSGAAFQRGVSHGRQAAARIAAGLDLYRDAFETVGVPWPLAMDHAERFRAAVQAFDADMAREMEGIAEGAGQSPAAIVALNARTEILFWHDQELGSAVSRGAGEECTSALALPGATRDGHVLHGQNWDWNPRCVETSIVLHVGREDGPGILTFCEAGQLARHGMNAAGVALTVNGLQSDLDGGVVGAPSPLLRRRLLSSPTLAGALETVLNTEIAFSHSLTISRAEGSAVTLETTPAKVYWMQPEGGLLVHANHFKCPIARAERKDVGLIRCPESLYRDQRVLERLSSRAGDLTLDDLRDAFSDTFGSPDAVLRISMRRSETPSRAAVSAAMPSSTRS